MGEKKMERLHQQPKNRAEFREEQMQDDNFKQQIEPKRTGFDTHRKRDVRSESCRPSTDS